MADSCCCFKVRAHCATYNHVHYITDALNGFVMQKTDFPYVCTIMDDASTDGEQEVIKKYLLEHFDLQDSSVAYEKDTDYGHVTFAQHKTNKNCFFAVIFLKENHYSQKKSKAPYLTEWMDTKYIALCEGDDYWTDPLKLQKQIDILEADDSLMAVVTNGNVVDKDGNELLSKVENVVPGNQEGRYDLRSFVFKTHNYLTASVCYRRIQTEEINRMKKRTANSYFGDWQLWFILHIFGDFYYVNQLTTSYRINPTSVTHTYDRVGRAKMNWELNESLKDILPEEYEDIRKSLDNTTWMWIDLGFAYRKKRQYIRMCWCFFVAFIKNPKELIDDFKRRINTKNRNRIEP